MELFRTQQIEISVTEYKNFVLNDAKIKILENAVNSNTYITRDYLASILGIEIEEE